GFVFGKRLHAVETSAGKSAEPDNVAALLSVFDAAEPNTALADGINELLVRKEGDLAAAIVLVSDGRDNASKISLDEVARECARLKVPLHIYGVGSSEGGILQLKDIGVPETLFYDDMIP